MLTPRLPPPPRSVWKDAVSIQITAEIIHDHCNNHSTESCCRGQKSPYPISFHISHYYYSAPAFLPELKKKETPHYIWTLCLPGQIGDVDLISMSGTGGFVDDRSLLLVTLPFLCLWFHASEAISVFPPYQCRKSEADINAFSSRNAILRLRTRFDICPAPGLADSAHRQALSINQPLD